VARFYYKGNHTHPVRRTVLIIESKPTYIRGYELREGAISRPFTEAPIKSYTRSKIARVKEIDRRRVERRRNPVSPQSTLKRVTLLDLVRVGP
jgi:hypothetical protein